MTLPMKTNLPLKMVTDRVQSSQAVLWALDAYGERLARVLGEALEPLLGPEQELPFAVQLDLFAQKLIVNRDRMVTTDRAYRDQRTRESLARGQRNTAAKEVNRQVVGIRRAFAGIYDAEKLAELGFARRTPQQPAELLEQASHLVARLSVPGLDLSGGRFGRFELAPGLWAKLAEAVAELHRAIDELARQQRQTEALKLAKDNGLDDYNRWFLWTARTVESLCKLAGLDDVAKRVRPSSRRPGTTEKRFETATDGPQSTSSTVSSATS